MDKNTDCKHGTKITGQCAYCGEYPYDTSPSNPMNTTKQTEYIEHDCTIEHEGIAFTSGGAYITDRHIVAYPGANGVLKNWHGDPIGTWKAVSTWRTPRSYMSSTMSQIEALVNGILYTGRGAGEEMIFKGKAKRS